MEHSLQKYLERLSTEVLELFWEQYQQDEWEARNDPILPLIQKELERRKLLKQKAPSFEGAFLISKDYISKGERCDRRRWRKKGAERVAAVDKIEE